MYLNCHSYFSLNYGLLSPRQLVKAAQAQGVKALALTDINSVSGAFEFVQACKEEGLHPIVGIEFRDERQELLYIGLARNRRGFHALNQLLSEGYRDGLPVVPPKLEDVFLIYPGLVKPIGHFRDYEFVGVRPESVNSLFSSSLRAYPERLVALCPVTLGEAGDLELHQVLRAVGHNTLISRIGPEDHARPSEVFRPVPELLAVYERYPQIIRNTARLFRSCSIDLIHDPGHNRRSFTGDPKEDRALLHKLAGEGGERRYGRRNGEARERLRKELQLIDRLGFTSYFLITWDLVKYAELSGIPHVGRGSGANSIVAYCIGITDVDPLGLNLYFERFINEHRSSPPDFDVDFPSDQRHLILDYLFKRYGRRHTAFVCTFDTFQFRSIAREVGKVYGLPKAEIDRIVANPQSPDEHHELGRRILAFGRRLQGLPNELSVHASGIIIAEQPLHDFSALRPMPFGFPVVHFDMYTAEDWGFNKFDILGQCGLSHIRDAVRYVHRNRGRTVDLADQHKIFNDPKAQALLKAGDTVGVFYAESPNMRELLPKLKCDNYPDLVVASSIIRPGVASSGMMREYLLRHRHPYAGEYLHPTFREHLSETHGIMVFQEDVMKICHAYAGLSLGESDLLRKIMSGKRRHSETFDMLRDKFFAGSRANGHPEDLTAEVWRQISSFAGYSFCKAHSAAFAVLSFQDLYLKAYYPLEFLTAVINNFGGFYRTEIYLHEARRHGAILHAPCVNRSGLLATLEGTDLYLGLTFILGLERSVAEEIVYNREQYGPYQSLADFTGRIRLSPTQLEILIKVNAFRFTGRNKYQLMWEKSRVQPPASRWTSAGSLFDVPDGVGELPELAEGPYDQAFDEIEFLKFPLRFPFELLDYDALGDRHKACIRARDLAAYVGKEICILGYFVCRKTTATQKGDLMGFDAWYDEAGDYFNTVIFPHAMREWPLRGIGIYLLRGKVTEEFGVHGIAVTRMEKAPYVRDERFG